MTSAKTATADDRVASALKQLVENASRPNDFEARTLLRDADQASSYERQWSLKAQVYIAQGNLAGAASEVGKILSLSSIESTSIVNVAHFYDAYGYPLKALQLINDATKFESPIILVAAIELNALYFQHSIFAEQLERFNKISEHCDIELRARVEKAMQEFNYLNQLSTKLDIAEEAAREMLNVALTVPLQFNPKARPSLGDIFQSPESEELMINVAVNDIQVNELVEASSELVERLVGLESFNSKLIISYSME